MKGDRTIRNFNVYRHANIDLIGSKPTLKDYFSKKPIYTNDIRRYVSMSRI